MKYRRGQRYYQVKIVSIEKDFSKLFSESTQLVALQAEISTQNLGNLSKNPLDFWDNEETVTSFYP